MPVAGLTEFVNKQGGAMRLTRLAVGVMWLGVMSSLPRIAGDVRAAEPPQPAITPTRHAILDPQWSDQPAGEISKRSISWSGTLKRQRFETLLNVKLPILVPVRWTNLHDGNFSLELFVTTGKQTSRRTLVINSADGSTRIDGVPQGDCLAILRSLDPQRPLFLSIKASLSDGDGTGLKFDGSQTGCLALSLLDGQNRSVDAGDVRITHTPENMFDRRLSLLRWKIEDAATWTNRSHPGSANIQRLNDGTFVITGLGRGYYSAEFQRNGTWERGGGEVKSDGGVYVELHQRVGFHPVPDDPTERAADLRRQLDRMQSPFAPVRAWGVVRLGYYGAGAVPAARQLVDALGDKRPVQTSVAKEHGLGSNVGSFAKTSLLAIGNGAVPELIRGLTDASPRVRWAAAEILGETPFRDAAAIEPLLALFEDPDCPNRWMAARSLGFLGGPATPRLVELARSGTVLQRRWAVCALGVHRAQETDGVVLAALDDPAAEVRFEAAEGLRDYGKARLTRPLIERLTIVDPQIRPLLIRALEYIRDDAVEELLAAVEAETTDVRIRRGCLEVLAHHFRYCHKNDVRALPLLHYMSDDDAEVRQWATATLQFSMKLIGPRVTFERISTALQDNNPRVQAEAATVCSEVAGRSGADPRLVPLMMRVLADAHRIWRDAPVEGVSPAREPTAGRQSMIRLMTVTAQALGKFKDRRAVEVLVQVVSKECDPGLKAVIVTALCEIADSKGAPFLRGELVTRNVAVIEALGRMGDTASFDELADLLEDDWDSKVRGAAATALGRLDDERAANPLMEALRRSAMSAFPYFREDFDAVALALGRVGGAEAAELMVRTAHRISPAEPRFEMGRSSFLPVETSLDQLLEWHPYPRSLSSIGPAALPSLVEGMGSEHALTRAVCASAIALLPDGPYTATNRWGGSDVWTHSEVFEVEFEREWASLTTALLKAILDDEPIVQLHAVRAAGRYGLEAAVPRLFEASTAPFKQTQLRGDHSHIPSGDDAQHHEVREAIAGALGEIGGVEAETHLRAMIDDGTLSVRLAAIRALGSAKTKESVAHLIALLKDHDVDVTVGAASSLGQTGNRSSIKPLIDCLADAQPDRLRAAAAQALGTLGADEARLELAHVLEPFDAVRLIQTFRSDSPDPRTEAQRWMLEATVVALVRLKDDAGESLLRRALASNNLPVHRWALQCLGWSIPERPVSQWADNASLLQLLRGLAVGDEEPHWRKAAITALRNPADDDSRVTLIACLKDGDPECHAAALTSLATQQPEQYMPILLQMQDDPSSHVRTTLAELLAQIMDPRGDQILLKLVDDGDATVGGTALKSLKGHDSPDVVVRLRQLERSTHSRHRRAVLKHLLQDRKP
jgi:HEAT repeat protein